MQCVMCVRSPPPLCKTRPCSSLAVGVLLTRREKGPFPAVEHLSVLTVFCVYLWHVSDVAWRKEDRCKSAEEKTAASEKFCRVW